MIRVAIAGYGNSLAGFKDSDSLPGGELGLAAAFLRLAGLWSPPTPSRSCPMRPPPLPSWPLLWPGEPLASCADDSIDRSIARAFRATPNPFSLSELTLLSQSADSALASGGPPPPPPGFRGTGGAGRRPAPAGCSKGERLRPAGCAAPAACDVVAGGAAAAWAAAEE